MSKIDLKATGYLISTASVIILGAVAWPGPDEPRIKMWALVIGMAASIVGMISRYIAHRQDKRAIRRAARHDTPDE